MTARFLHNFDALVTTDYLDTRLTEFETRIEASMERRFTEVDKRFTEVDKRFIEVDRQFTDFGAGIDRRFADLRLEMYGEFGAVRGELGDVRGTLKLHSWMSALLIAGIFIPLLQGLLH